MNKEEMIKVLSCCLLSFAGWNKEGLQEEGYSDEIIKLGRGLNKYLSNKELRIIKNAI